VISAFRPADEAPKVIGMPTVFAGNAEGDQALAQVVAIPNAHRQDPLPHAASRSGQKPVTMRGCPGRLQADSGAR
jgi:hypothetical protein